MFFSQGAIALSARTSSTETFLPGAHQELVWFTFSPIHKDTSLAFGYRRHSDDLSCSVTISVYENNHVQPKLAGRGPTLQHWRDFTFATV